MQTLQKGTFFGVSKKHFHINELTVVDSAFYQYKNCPWHYHENAHFAFTTKGNLVETHKHKKIQLSAGCLLYNHSQEPHWNSHYSENVAALHIEINSEWFKKYDLKFSMIEGVQELQNPILKKIFINIFRELKLFDTTSSLSVESMILQALTLMMKVGFKKTIDPAWVAKVERVLRDRFNEQLMLHQVALELNIHPVYLCQQFPIHFNCSFGEYIRLIRVEKAVGFILQNSSLSLTEISYSCGFADQSHFIRTFKKHTGLTPLAFKKLALK